MPSAAFMQKQQGQKLKYKMVLQSHALHPTFLSIFLSNKTKLKISNNSKHSISDYSLVINKSYYLTLLAKKMEKTK